jgi:hypothetical protein
VTGSTVTSGRISFFILFAGKVAKGRRCVVATGQVFCLIGCFVFILNFYIFLKNVVVSTCEWWAKNPTFMP